MRSLVFLVVALAASSQARFILSTWTRTAPVVSIRRTFSPAVVAKVALETEEVNPCEEAQCGHNAECHIKDNQPAICKCPAGTSGDPFERCFLNPCLGKNPCGVNAECTFNRAGEAVCSCPPHYMGDPYVACGPITTKVEETEPTFINPCLTPGVCGLNAECTYTGRPAKAVCSCPPHYMGDPYVACGPITTKVEDPCLAPDACGINAECKPLNFLGAVKAVCSSPPHYLGDPYVACGPITTKEEETKKPFIDPCLAP